MLILVCVAPAPGATQRHRGYPAWWRAQARCIHWHEAAHIGAPGPAMYRRAWKKNWHLTTVYGTGYRSVNRGGFQINVSTWKSYAPHGYPTDPAAATRPQQVTVAHRIWTANGHRWGGNQWPSTAAACGVA